MASPKSEITFCETMYVTFWLAHLQKLVRLPKVSQQWTDPLPTHLTISPGPLLTKKIMFVGIGIPTISLRWSDHCLRLMTGKSISIRLMGHCKKDITPLLTHWSYVFLALTHQDGVFYVNRGPEQCCFCSSFRIADNGIKFGSVMHSNMQHMAISDGCNQSFFACSMDAEISYIIGLIDITTLTFQGFQISTWYFEYMADSEQTAFLCCSL